MKSTEKVEVGEEVVINKHCKSKNVEIGEKFKVDFIDHPYYFLKNERLSFITMFSMFDRASK